MLLLPAAHFVPAAAAVAASAACLLDTLTATALGAYGPRRLRAAYTGPAMRVRRSSDNAEQDIGFTSGGDLDTSTMLTFVGSGSGFVSKWYDQSGTGNHLTQATASNQPQMVGAGVAKVLGNATAKPSPYFNGATYLLCSPGITGSALSFFAVGQEPTGSSNNRMVDYCADGDNQDYNSSNKIILMIFDGSGNIFAFSGGYLSKGSYTTAPFQASSVMDGVANTVTVNGATNGGVNSAYVNLAATNLLVGTGSGGGFAGSLAEGLLFGSSIPTAADIAAIRTSQKSYYGTP